ncbi:MAG: hypothetical protein ACRD3V_07220, partial [Vicinamibacteria bacterium]
PPPQDGREAVGLMSRPNWRDVIPVHPAADVFPLLDPWAHKNLAKDIDANGLRNPVLVWSDADGKEWLLDGRNRLDALARLGIFPPLPPGMWDTIEVDDPAAYVISANIQRRHLSARERVELVEKVLAASAKTGKSFPVSSGGRGNKGRSALVAGLAGVSKPTAHKYRTRTPEEEAAERRTKERSKRAKAEKGAQRRRENPKQEYGGGISISRMVEIVEDFSLVHASDLSDDELNIVDVLWDQLERIRYEAMIGEDVGDWEAEKLVPQKGAER